MGSVISDIAYQLPAGVLTNEEIELAFPEWKAAKVEKKIGVRQRHIAASDETAADLATQAAQKLLARTAPEEIDFLLFCTQSPDYLLPTSACLIQQKLGLRQDAGALDFNLGCSGYIYGLALAKGLVESGISRKVLLLTGETYSKFLAADDVGNRSIFGDGGSATLISASEERGIGEFELGTDGRGAANLIVEQPSARNGYRYRDAEAPVLYMNGPEIFNFTIETIPPLIQRTLEKNRLKIDDVNYVILHQANKYILEFLISQMGIDPAKCHIDMLDYGNTVSNTIPIALKDALDKQLVKEGDKVLLAGFGVGYSWGAVTLTI